MINIPFQWYTSVTAIGDKIRVRGRTSSGKPLSFEYPFKPSYFLISQRPTAWKTLDGRYAREVEMESVYIAHQWKKQYEDVDGFEIHGDIASEYQFIAHAFPATIPYDFNAIRIGYFDIEVAGERKFPNPQDAAYPVNVISWYVNGVMHVWGNSEYGPYTAHQPDIEYHECESEQELLMEFLTFYESDYPDIITGWNTSGFDIPYLINRLTCVFDDATSRRLSPYGRIKSRKVTFFGQEHTFLDLVGVASLDYLELYKKHTFTQQENYRLDTIAHVELNERKLTFEDLGNIHQLYRRDYQKFVEYNVQDTRLVKKLDAKKKLLELVTTLAYDAKVNYLDTFKQVRMWDAMVYYHLRDRGIVIPPNQHRGKSSQYAGAYVKESLAGLHKWVASFDINSLYPALMRQWNISPDKHVPEFLLERRLLQINAVLQGKTESEHIHISGVHPEYLWADPSTLSIEDAFAARYCINKVLALMRKMSVEFFLTQQPDLLDAHDAMTALELTVTPNKQAFRIDTPGFMPEILTRLYSERVKAKDFQIEAEHDFAAIEEEMQRRGLA